MPRAAWLIVALLVLAAIGSAAAASAEARTLLPQCQDNVDNDGDGELDYPDDPGCSGWGDTNEANSSLPDCSDRVDNDRDGRIDFPQEPGCSTGADGNESNSSNPASRPACSNGTDEDADTRIDYPADPGCGWASEKSEADTECSDGFDNDGDGRADFPADLGCSNNDDATETDPPQCDDGRDNDGDVTVDHEADSDCDSAQDPLEGPHPVCSDGIDNDGDGKADFPADPGCSFSGDGDETDTVIYSLPVADRPVAGPPAGPATAPPGPVTGSAPSPRRTVPRARLLSPFPIVRLRGRLDPRGVRITLLTVRAPARSKVSVYCSGTRCPRRRVAITAGRKLVRVRQFERRMRGGTTLTIYVTRTGFIGKYTRFRFVGKRVPLRIDRCAIRPGASSRACPSS